RGPARADAQARARRDAQLDLAIALDARLHRAARRGKAAAERAQLVGADLQPAQDEAAVGVGARARERAAAAAVGVDAKRTGELRGRTAHGAADRAARAQHELDPQARLSGLEQEVLELRLREERRRV